MAVEIGSDPEASSTVFAREGWEKRRERWAREEESDGASYVPFSPVWTRRC